MMDEEEVVKYVEVNIKEEMAKNVHKIEDDDKTEFELEIRKDTKAEAGNRHGVWSPQKMTGMKQSVGMKLRLALPLGVRVDDLVLADDQRLGDTNIAGKVIMASSI